MAKTARNLFLWSDSEVTYAVARAQPDAPSRAGFSLSPLRGDVFA